MKNDPILRLILSDGAPVRREMIDQILSGTDTFYRRYHELTLKEVLAAFKIEQATQQRKSVMNRLSKRANALVAQLTSDFFERLKEQ